MDTSTPPEPTGNIDYNASPSHLGGQTDNNGVVTNWGPGWDNLGQSMGDFDFEDAVLNDESYKAVESVDDLPPDFASAAYS